MKRGSNVVENKGFEPFQPLRPTRVHLLCSETGETKKHGVRQRAQMSTIQTDARAEFWPPCHSECDPRRFLQCGIVTCAARCQAAEPIRTQPFAGEARNEPAEASPGEAIVVVGTIAHEGEPLALAIIYELGLRDRQERPYQLDGRCERALGAHTREACGPASRQQTHQNRLGLIVTGVSSEHEFGTDGFSMSREEGVTRHASGLLKTPRRFRSGPAQGSVRKAERLSESRDRRGFRARFAP